MKKITLFLLLGFIFITGCTAPTQTKSASTADNNVVTETPSTEKDTVEKKVYQFDDLKLTLLDGTETSLYAYEGKTIILNFWTTQCQYCSMLMPHLNTLNEREDLVVLAVNIGDSKKAIESYLDGKGYGFEIFMDEDGELASLLAIRGFPTTFFISPEYELYLLESGYRDLEYLESILKDIQAFEEEKK